MTEGFRFARMWGQNVFDCQQVGAEQPEADVGLWNLSVFDYITYCNKHESVNQPGTALRARGRVSDGQKAG